MASDQPQRLQAAYIVQQHEDGCGRSTYHVTSSPLNTAEWTARQKPEPQVTSPAVVDNEQSSPAPEPPRQGVWQRLTSAEKAKKAKEPNATKRRYDDMWQAGLGRWVSSIIVLGLAAGIISKGPDTPLLEIAVVNLICASLHFFLLGPTVVPRSPTDPRPPPWYLAVLAVSSAAWAAVSGAMFAVLSDSDEYVVVDLDKRGLGRLAGNGIGAGVGSVEILKNLDRRMRLLRCRSSWWYVFKLFTKPVTEEEMQDCNARLNKKPVHL